MISLFYYFSANINPAETLRRNRERANESTQSRHQVPSCTSRNSGGASTQLPIDRFFVNSRQNNGSDSD